MALTQQDKEELYDYIVGRGQSIASLPDGDATLSNKYLGPVIEYTPGGTAARLVRLAVSLLQGKPCSLRNEGGLVQWAVEGTNIWRNLFSLEDITGKSAYAVAVENGYTGTEAEWLASLKGETGDTGPVGPTGETGPVGPPGPKGEGLDYSTMTPEEVASITGKSAYAIAVENGYSGTESDWLVSLKGEPGKDGAGNVSVPATALKAGINYLFKPSADGSAEGEFIEYVAPVQVQSDWSTTDAASDTYIQNKPVLKPVATSGSYNDLTDKPTEITSAKISNSIGNGGFLADGNNPAPINGLLWSNDSTAGFPGEYKHGNILQLSNLNTPDVNGEWSWINQLLFGTNSRIYHRNFTNVNGWGTWARLAYSYEIPDLDNLTKSITINNTHTTDGTKIGITGAMGGTDYWGIYSYSNSNDAGALEIATGDNGTEPIYVRQYSGWNPASAPISQAVRTAVLLDENGNTSFPGTVSSGGQVLVKTNDTRLYDARPVYSTNIGKNEDLDNYSTPGFYHCIYNSIVATLKNSPTPNAFALVVMRTTDHSCVQFLTTYPPNSAELYYRNSLWNSATNTTIFGHWQKIYTTFDKPPLATTSEAGLMPAADKAFLDYFQGYNAVTSLVNLPLNKRLILCSLSSVSGSFSFNGTPESGREYHIIVSNSTSSAITQSINIGANSVYFGGNKITIPAGGYVEVNVLCVDGSMFYVRSGGQ